MKGMKEFSYWKRQLEDQVRHNQNRKGAVEASDLAAETLWLR